VDHSPRAAPHGFSQLATSFLACPRLGIPRVPLPRLTSPPATPNPSRAQDRTRPASPSSAPKALYLPTITPIVKKQRSPVPGAQGASGKQGPRTRRGPSASATRIGDSDGATGEAFRVLAGLTRRSRKEVIQPQVPLRLPCYDFAPVIELAFGRCLPCGLAHGLRALPTSMA
jgi:hypothetical protein